MSNLDPYKLLFDAVCTGTTDDIIRQANRLFGLPVLFVDEFFHMKAMHPATSFGCAEWDEIRRNKAMDHRLAWDTLDEYMSDQQRFYAPFYAETGSCENQPKLFGQLVKDDVVVGHVIVFWYGDKPGADDFKLMTMVLDSLKVKTESRDSSRWSMSLSAKLQDLLDNNTPPRIMSLAVEGVAAAMEPEYVIIVAPVGSLPSHRAFGEYALYQLRQSFRNVLGVVLDSAVVTLVGGQRRENASGSRRHPEGGLISRLLDFFESHNMICGLSNCYTDVAKTHVHYRQALLAATLAVELGKDRSQAFIDLMPLPIFQSLRQADEPETFVHPAIYDMLEHDRKNSTDYYNTMRAYCLSVYDRDRAAAKLSIHRNTLLYRLGRIGELFALPYEDEDVALNLLCSFLLLQSPKDGLPADQNEKRK